MVLPEFILFYRSRGRGNHDAILREQILNNSIQSLGRVVNTAPTKTNQHALSLRKVESQQ